MLSGVRTVVVMLVQVHIFSISVDSIVPGIAWPGSPDPGLYRIRYVRGLVALISSAISTYDVGDHYRVFDACRLHREIDFV